MRRCAQCGQEKQEEFFLPTNSKFHPDGRTIYCINCLERMVPADNLAEVDKLMQWLDWPFFVDKWTQLHRNAGPNTLHLYAKLMTKDGKYESIDWARTNEQWKHARDAGTLSDQISEVKESWVREMEHKWPSETERDVEDYRYLEELYTDLTTTQNIITATQRDDAKRLCELGLLINQKIRAGVDAKNEMAMYHNIIKVEGFEPKNSKSPNDFDSVGELYNWLSRIGWRPHWHEEPHDVVDFTMKNSQTFLRRLVQGEGSLSEGVEKKKQEILLADKLEQENDLHLVDAEQEAMNNIEYEDAPALDEDFDEDGDDDCLN